MGTIFPSASTCGLWPGEERPNGRDYETIFRSVIYNPGDVETYHLKMWGGPGSIQSFEQWYLSGLTPVSRIKRGISEIVTLSQNYPNPFNPSTTIRYGLPSRSHVTLSIFNTLGQQVATLVEGEMEAGYHEVQFDASGLASGVYLYRLQAGDFVQTKRLLLLK